MFCCVLFSCSMKRLFYILCLISTMCVFSGFFYLFPNFLFEKFGLIFWTGIGTSMILIAITLHFFINVVFATRVKFTDYDHLSDGVYDWVYIGSDTYSLRRVYHNRNSGSVERYWPKDHNTLLVSDVRLRQVHESMAEHYFRIYHEGNTEGSPIRKIEKWNKIA